MADIINIPSRMNAEPLRPSTRSLSLNAPELAFAPRNAFTDSGLSATETRILLAASAGSSNKAIARSLNRSEFTIRNQLSSAYRKLGVSNRVEAMSWLKRMDARPAE